MATTENNYTASGSQTLYSFTFPYIDTTDIKVSVDDVVKTLTTHYTLASATQIQFNTAPSASAKIRIYRDTDTDNKKATFFSGSAIRSQDLNEDFDQVLYSVQEMKGEVADFPTDHWNVTTETLDSSEAFVDSDSYVMTAKAIQDRIDATSPALFDATKVAKAGDTMTGDLILDNAKEIRWSEADANGSHYIGWKAPAAVTANKTFTLPDGFPSVSGHALKSDTSGVMSWGTAGGAVGPGTDQIFWENDQTVSDDYTITNNKNAGSFGPITVASGKTVTVGAGEVWTVV
tara:strand:- start:58 stop:924 length:867 start_codon:yes stop_codon:yes gene_type:complete